MPRRSRRRNLTGKPADGELEGADELADELGSRDADEVIGTDWLREDTVENVVLAHDCVEIMLGCAELPGYDADDVTGDELAADEADEAGLEDAAEELSTELAELTTTLADDAGAAELGAAELGAAELGVAEETPVLKGTEEGTEEAAELATELATEAAAELAADDAAELERAEE